MAAPVAVGDRCAVAGRPKFRASLLWLVEGDAITLGQAGVAVVMRVSQMAHLLRELPSGEAHGTFYSAS